MLLLSFLPKQLLVPRGFAHGFVVLSKEATFAYKVDNYYAPDCDRGIAFDDNSLGIDWKINLDVLQLSPKDLKQPLFKDADYFNHSITLYD
jgi:dTDP-4-dehydrorhamnose 3,5-epimerase